MKKKIKGKSTPKSARTSSDEEPSESDSLEKVSRPKSPGGHDNLELHSQLPFPVVGIGASAGGLESIRLLLKYIPKSTGMAFVVITHLDPGSQSTYGEILSRDTVLPVQTLTKNTRIKKNHIYVNSPGTEVRLRGDALIVSPRPLLNRNAYHPIDVFLISLANAQSNKAIAVILSGMGNDGTEGVKAVNSEGGICFAQDLASAAYPSMPEKAAASGCIDYVLPPDGIGHELAKISQHPLIKPHRPTEALLEPKNLSVYGKILFHINQRHGLDFSMYKQSTIVRRIRRRMVLHKLINLQTYLEYLQKTPHEVYELLDDLLIKVTSFFRDSSAFDQLQAEVFPRLINRDAAGESIRIWVVGCSTGEEVYSIAISLFEFLGDNVAHTNIQIFASDVSERAISIARAGIYPESISDQMSKERLRRFFVKVEQGYQVSKALREKCVFAVHNVTKDPPFSKVDLVSCRNLLIYFSPDLQKLVIPLLHYSLNNNGILFLGSSESINGFTQYFSTLDAKQKLFVKKPVAHDYRTALTNRSFANTNVAPQSHAKMPPIIHTDDEIISKADLYTLQHLAPPGFIINRDLTILQIRGDVSVFANLAAGKPTTNLAKIIREEFLVPLRSMLGRVQNSGYPEFRDGIAVTHGGKKLKVRLDVIPLSFTDNDQQFFLVLMTKSITGKAVERISAGGKHRGDIREQDLFREYKRLEHELAETKESLQAYIEEQEAANEELKSSNEEILSSNEELQSANEELQTSKEEIQSVNEELNTLNDELESRNIEIAKVNDDLENLIESTRIPFIILDSKLCIRRFTPPAKKLFKLIPSDVGRPISDIKPNFEFPELDELVADVIESIQTRSVELKDSTGKWYSMVIRPYRTSENKIDGVILSLMDIHDLKMGFLKEQRLATVLRNSLDAITVQDLNGNILEWNSGAERVYGYAANEALNMNVRALIPEAKRKEAMEFFDEIKKGAPSMTVETERLAKDGRILDILLVATPVNDSANQLIGVATTERDITATKRSDELFRALLDSAPTPTIITNREHEMVLVNEIAETAFGYKREDLIGKSYRILVPERRRTKFEEHCSRYLNNPIRETIGEPDDDAAIVKSDGTELPVSIHLSPIKTSQGLLICRSFVDVSARKQVLEQLKAAKSNADTANVEKSEFLANMSHEIRTPLSAITGFAELLSENHQLSGAQQAAYINTILRSGKHLASLIDNILDISRVESGVTEIETISFALRTEIDAVIEPIKLKAENSGLDFVVRYKSLIPEIIESDPTRFRQILFNVLGNAFKFTHAGSIYLDIAFNNAPDKNSQSELVFTVTDTGCGIDPAFQSRIFQIFRQADSSTTRKFGGTGLGLHLSRKLARLLGGDVVLKTSSPGKGSTFQITIPAKTCENVRMISGDVAAMPVERNSPLPDLTGQTLLLVEDAPDNQVLFRAVLTRAGADVHIAPDGKKAIELALANYYDVILMDIQLPEIDGLNATSQLRKAGYHRPIIALTAHAMLEERDRCIKAGCDDYLSKPVPFAKLIETIAKWSKK